MKVQKVNLMAGFGFDPHWTIEEAYKAGAVGPESPFFRWVGWQELSDLKKAYELGEKAALLKAAYKCAQHGLPMPAWVGNAFAAKYLRWTNLEYKTLDEAFEVKLAKGVHINALRKQKFLNFLVPMEVKSLQDAGMKTDKALFEAVVKRLPAGYKASASQVEKTYYATQKNKKNRPRKTSKKSK